mgnify:CR=1 FL=1
MYVNYLETLITKCSQWVEGIKHPSVTYIYEYLQ